MGRLALALPFALALGCSCESATQNQPAAGGSDAGAESAAGSSGASGTAGAGGAPDAALDGDAGANFDCAHVVVVEDCVGGWCRIPAGCFVMGSPATEWGRGAYDEDQVKVTLTHSFAIQEKETSQGEWTALVAKNPSQPPLKPGNSGDCLDPACPVGNLTWYEAAAFANLWSQKDGLTPCYELTGCTGQLGEGMTCTGVGVSAPTYYECAGYRLPGEAEWEYAARAGTTTAFYTGEITTLDHPGTCADDPNLVGAAWYCTNSGDVTHKGGLKAKNSWGLFDMLGNAHEWTNDKMKGLGYGSAPLVDPWGQPISGSATEAVVLRGGGPITPSSRCRAAGHFSVPPQGHGGGLGVRLVRTLPNADAGTADAGGSDAAASDADALDALPGG